MQPNRGETQAMRTRTNGSSKSSISPSSTITSQLPLPDLHLNSPHPLTHNRLLSRPDEDDDFFNQMLFTIPSWPELPKPHWNLSAGAGNKPVAGKEGLPLADAPFDESSLLAAQLRQQQISTHQHNQKQHHLLLSAMARSHESPVHGSATDSGLFPTLPLSLGGSVPGADSNPSFKLPNCTGVGYCASQAQHFLHSQGGPMPQQSIRLSPPTSPAIIPGSAAAGAAPRQRVRARRGQATDPHSIAERLRRERIAERMKALQELVPNANKADKASMLDEIIDYVKFLQLQVKVLSMSRLGAAAAGSPLIADSSSEASPAMASETMSVMENLVAKLMEEDMGSAMQYLQGKGLCLMPISLASVISTATSPSPAGGLLAAGRLLTPGEDARPPPSPSMSVLTVQSRSSDKDPVER